MWFTLDFIVTETTQLDRQMAGKIKAIQTAWTK